MARLEQMDVNGEYNVEIPGEAKKVMHVIREAEVDMVRSPVASSRVKTKEIAGLKISQEIIHFASPFFVACQCGCGCGHHCDIRIGPYFKIRKGGQNRSLTLDKLSEDYPDLKEDSESRAMGMIMTEIEQGLYPLSPRDRALHGKEILHGTGRTRAPRKVSTIVDKFWGDVYRKRNYQKMLVVWKAFVKMGGNVKPNHLNIQKKKITPPKEVPLQICTCNHSKKVHEGDHGVCKIKGCPCLDYWLRAKDLSGENWENLRKSDSWLCPNCKGGAQRGYAAPGIPVSLNECSKGHRWYSPFPSRSSRKKKVLS